MRACAGKVTPATRRRPRNKQRSRGERYASHTELEQLQLAVGLYRKRESEFSSSAMKGVRARTPSSQTSHDECFSPCGKTTCTLRLNSSYACLSPKVIARIHMKTKPVSPYSVIPDIQYYNTCRLSCHSIDVFSDGVRRVEQNLIP